MSGHSQNRNEARGSHFWIPPFLVVACWFPAMVAASHAWSHGEYYDYGWFVPPAAVFLVIQRWRGSTAPTRPISGTFLAGMALVMLPLALILRVLGHADPAWRMPIGLLGGMALIASHTVLTKARGWRESAGYLWISLFWASALPWPSVIEGGIVQWFTDLVVSSVTEIFQLSGRPVEMLGDRLQLHDMTVEVTDGCSGVRSFQSFLMATWFFSELQRLRTDRVLILLAGGCVAAFLVNLARTYLLAIIRFDHGQDAFDRAHDGLGFAAFAVSALFFYWFSGKLAQNTRRVTVRRRQDPPPGEGNSPPLPDMQ